MPNSEFVAVVKFSPKIANVEVNAIRRGATYEMLPSNDKVRHSLVLTSGTIQMRPQGFPKYHVSHERNRGNVGVKEVLIAGRPFIEFLDLWDRSELFVRLIREDVFAAGVFKAGQDEKYLRYVSEYETKIDDLYPSSR